jgi:hypothetical protein
VLHAQYVTGNPLTGRQVWIVRHIPHGGFGAPYDWCCNVIRPHHFSRTAVVEAMVGKDMTLACHRELQAFIKEKMGFRRCRALRRGRWVLY